MNLPLPPRARVVAAIGCAQLLAWGSSYYLLATLAQPMAQTLGLPTLAVYAMFSAALLLAAAIGPFSGRIIDRYGGRSVLMASNGVFALAQLMLATAQGPATLALGWLLIGAAMPLGLYDAAFATLVRLYREDARRAIVGVTLIAGFASSVSWPLTAAVEHLHGWRAACAMWAALHLTVGLGLHAFMLPRGRRPAGPNLTGLLQPAAGAVPTRGTLWLLAGVFTTTGFAFAAMATHLPRLLEAVGCTPAAAVAAAALVGASQVAGRLAEVGWLNRLHPLISARLATAAHPLGVLLLSLIGAPFAALFAILHGAGTGLMTIVKGTLPLALFGHAGFGRRAGLLEAPSRVAQALAPMVFGYALDRYGAQAMWLTGGVALAGFAGVMLLRLDARNTA